jgi:hypothetical protein
MCSFNISSISSEEKDAYERYKMLKRTGGLRVTVKEERELFRKYRAIRHLESRYPSNLLDVFSLPTDAKADIDEYESLLMESKEEKPLQDFFNIKPYFIASLLCETNFGHHATYAFSQFQIANKYRPDFVLAGKSSQGYGWVFIELQSPNCNLMLKNGMVAQQPREGLHQIKLWQEWFRKHLGYAKSSDGLDMEGLNEARMLYYLVVGSRDKYNEEANDWRDREMATDKSLRIISYDRLINTFKTIIDRRNF